MEEKEKMPDLVGKELMEFIIAKTFSRHSMLSEENYLKAIGFENSGKTEEEAVRIAFLNVLVETTKELISTKESFNLAKQLIKISLDEKGE